MLGIWKLAISLPLLLINPAVATDGQEVSQNVFEIADNWVLLGYPQVNCKGNPAKVSSSAGLSCNAIGEEAVMSYAFLGPKIWKVCMWGDDECPDKSYAGSSIGNEIFQCRKLVFEDSATAFTVISNTTDCGT